MHNFEDTGQFGNSRIEKANDLTRYRADQRQSEQCCLPSNERDGEESAYDLSACTLPFNAEVWGLHNLIGKPA